MNHDAFETALRRDGFDIEHDALPAGTVVAERVNPFDVARSC